MTHGHPLQHSGSPLFFFYIFILFFLFLQIVDHDRHVDCALILLFFFCIHFATFARTESTSEVTSSIFRCKFIPMKYLFYLFADLFNGLCHSWIFFWTACRAVDDPRDRSNDNNNNNQLLFFIIRSEKWVREWNWRRRGFTQNVNSPEPELSALSTAHFNRHNAPSHLKTHK